MTRIELLHAATKELNGRLIAGAQTRFSEPNDEEFNTNWILTNFWLYHEAKSALLALKRIRQACFEIQNGINMEENYNIIATLVNGDAKVLYQSFTTVAKLSNNLLAQLEDIPGIVYKYRSAAPFYEQGEEDECLVSVHAFPNYKEQQACLSDELLTGVLTVQNMQHYESDMEQIRQIALEQGPVEEILTLL